jgi:hypothetical protein
MGSVVATKAAAAQKPTTALAPSHGSTPPGAAASSAAVPATQMQHPTESTPAAPARPNTAQPTQQVDEALPALQLVRQLPDGVTYELCAPAVQQLLAIGSTPVAVVSIAGVARQGKSYVLNRLLQAAGGGFPVSARTDPCMHGIWMWPQAVPVQGKQHKLVSSSVKFRRLQSSTDCFGFSSCCTATAVTAACCVLIGSLCQAMHAHGKQHSPC